MKIYTFSQARQNLLEVLNRSKSETVLIRRRTGEVFAVTSRAPVGSPFDVPGVNTKVRTADILAAVREVHRRAGHRK
jgi:hypothetical protein